MLVMLKPRFGLNDQITFVFPLFIYINVDCVVLAVGMFT